MESVPIVLSILLIVSLRTLPFSSLNDLLLLHFWVLCFTLFFLSSPSPSRESNVVDFVSFSLFVRVACFCLPLPCSPRWIDLPVLEPPPLLYLQPHLRLIFLRNPPTVDITSRLRSFSSLVRFFAR